MGWSVDETKMADDQQLLKLGDGPTMLFCFFVYCLNFSGIHRAERPQPCRGTNPDTHLLGETHQPRAEGGKLDRKQYTWDDFSQDEPMVKKPEQRLPQGKEKIA